MKITNLSLAAYLSVSNHFCLMSVKRRYHVRKALLKQLTREVVERFGEPAAEILKGAVEVVDLGDGREVILVGGEMLLFRLSEGIFPSLKSLDRIPLKRVVVDMGAVPHVANGADVMAPGVVSADEGIVSGDGVVIVDERHGKPFAIGQALAPGAEMRGSKGKMVKNLHHVGDGVWQFQAKG
jgi:PUA domain protein